MLNLNANGKINSGDYIYLIRHLVLIMSSISLGYTISDLDPSIHKYFTTSSGQLISIFAFLVSGLVKFRNNKTLIHQLIFMLFLSIVSTFIIQQIKEKITHTNNK